STFFLLPKYLTTALKAGPDEVGYVGAAAVVAAVLAVPLLGRAIDHYDRRRLIIGGGLVCALSALCFIPVQSVGLLLIALRAVQGISMALVFTAAATLVTDLAPPARMGQALGLFGVSALITNAIAPAVGEFVASHWGWSMVFVISAVAATACAGLALFLPRRARSTAHTVSQRPSYGPRVRRVLYAITIVGIAFGTMFTFSLPFALELGAREVSGFFLGYTLSAATLRIALGGWVDRVGRARVAVAALGIYGAALFATVGLKPQWLAALGALLGVGHGLVFPALNALVVEGVRVEHRGRVLSLFNGCFNAGVAISTLTLGTVAKHFGYPIIFAGAGVITLSGLPMLLKVARTPPELRE
ncbi:MAG TPA: MFS transporter, partial [Polyangiaceae bacterium]|nr:MFS transporter [Polyangiaceae bacterium]